MKFIMSNSITNQNQFESHELVDAYASSLRNNNIASFTHESLGVFPGSAEMSHTRHLMDLLGAAANDSNHHHHHHQQQQTQQQALNLSLGSHMINVPSSSSDEYNRQQRSLIGGLMNPNNYFIQGQQDSTSDYFFNTTGATTSFASLNRSPSTSYGSTESFAAVIGNSRYLKPVQSLLEDLVDVGVNVVDSINEKYLEKLFHGGRTSARTLSSELKAELRITGPLLAERQEHQMKIAKLITLLDEAENRYEKYYQQMEGVVSSFEVIAGLGAAKCYTAMALQAMSRHFCSLRDAIVSQINVEKRKLFQDLPKINSDLSQLSLFDREKRRSQGRMTLQQLGMIQSQRQVWRPIRGLPETSVVILRSWLFEHFLHPYPNDSEKLLLASQTGLTKNQVSNWFINARVRLWKPMIEEMYKEEFGDSSEDSDPPPAAASATTDNCLED